MACVLAHRIEGRIAQGLQPRRFPSIHGGLESSGTRKLAIELDDTKKVTVDNPAGVSAIGTSEYSITHTVKGAFGTQKAETYSLSR